MNYLHWREEERKAKIEKDQARALADLDDLVMAEGEQDADGHYRLDFQPIPNQYGGNYVALQKRRTIRPSINEDRALILLEKKGLLDEAAPLERVLDHNALYALVIQGKISEDDLDGLTDEIETFTLQVLEDD